MALTKVSGSIIKDSVSLSGNVSVGGTLTYQDVTNVDAVGIVTARTGLKVLAGGANIVGVVTATQFKGDGSQLTGISAGVSLANGADNRVVTATGAAALNGESGLTFDGSQLVIETSAQNNLKINSSNSDGPNIHFERSGTAFAYLGSAAANTGGTATDLALRAQGNLLFATNGSNERLRITSAGLVGIGTDNPSYPLSVVTSSGKSSIEIKSHGTGANDDVFLRMRPAGTNKDCFIDFGDDDDHDIGGIRYNHSNDFMAFTTNANERLRITSGGLVGINNTNPDRVLEVTKNDTACAKFGGAGGGSDFAIEIGQLSTSSSPGFNATGGSAMLFRNNGVESMRLIAGGAVVGFQTSTAADAKCVNVYTTGSNDGKYAMQIENGYGSGGGGNILKMKCARGDGTVDVDLVRLDLYNNTRIFSIDNGGLMRFRSGCGSGSQDALAVYGVRAWINFNATSGNAIRGKGGLSGITDRGVGQFTFNFSTNMPDGNYTVTCNSGNQSSGTSNRNRMSAYSLTTSNFRIDDYDSGAGNTPGHSDRQIVHVMVVR